MTPHLSKGVGGAPMSKDLFLANQGLENYRGASLQKTRVQNTAGDYSSSKFKGDSAIIQSAHHQMSGHHKRGGSNGGGVGLHFGE